ncbi:MAG: hypothetical protein K2V38_28340 [Gemmataceae bacterium]|nr:hypothetical protein [Gemmataceae bacterium]
MSDTATIDHSKKHPAFTAHSVRDAADGKSYWSRIGVAWANKNGKGFVVQLEAVPLDGRVVLLPPSND